MEVLTIAGARPNFVKIAPLVPALARRGLVVSLVHTGQHYDSQMSDAFFDELGIPAPVENLGVGSGSAVWQIAETMKRLEPILMDRRPAVVVVVGDVNSTLAGALTAVKLRIPVAHVEAGLRSFDPTMPEELNRRLTDAASRWLFTTERAGGENLLREGAAPERIFFVGNVMIDTLVAQRERALAGQPWQARGLTPGNYALLTLHRPGNVDDPSRLESLLSAIGQIAKRLPVLLLAHPRTQARLLEGRLAAPGGVIVAGPAGYLEMLGLLDQAALIVTDSGGVQEEACALGTPCLTLRPNTERPVTVEVGANRLVSGEPGELVAAADAALVKGRAAWPTPPLWDGHASDRIAAILARELGGSAVEVCHG